MLPLHRTLPNLRTRVSYSNLHPLTPKQLDIHPHSRNFNSVVLCQGSKTQNNGRKNSRRNRRKIVDHSVEETELTELMKIVELLPKHLRKPLESHPELPNVNTSLFSSHTFRRSHTFDKSQSFHVLTVLINLTPLINLTLLANLTLLINLTLS